jgi:NitT/TauT family transport system permease protein
VSAARADASRSLRIAAPVLVGIAVLAAWHALVTAFDVPKYLVPSPVDVARTLVADWALLSGALAVTLKITFFAFLCATALGTLIAFAFVQSRLVEASFFPYAILLQVTPVVAIAPLVIIWVENIQVALVLCATIVAIFPVISNTPYFVGGLRISSGLALIGAVVAEFVAGTGGHGAGLAYQILQAGFQLNIPRLFAALFLITVAGVALYLAMVWLSRLALGHWHESELAAEG